MCEVFMIWATDGSEPWLIEAWDEFTIDGNPSGWKETLVKAYRDYGYDNVVVTRAQVDYAAVTALFTAQVPDVSFKKGATHGLD